MNIPRWALIGILLLVAILVLNWAFQELMTSSIAILVGAFILWLLMKTTEDIRQG